MKKKPMAMKRGGKAKMMRGGGMMVKACGYEARW